MTVFGGAVLQFSFMMRSIKLYKIFNMLSIHQLIVDPSPALTKDFSSRSKNCKSFLQSTTGSGFLSAATAAKCLRTLSKDVKVSCKSIQKIYIILQWS